MQKSNQQHRSCEAGNDDSAATPSFPQSCSLGRGEAHALCWYVLSPPPFQHFNCTYFSFQVPNVLFLISPWMAKRLQSPEPVCAQGMRRHAQALMIRFSFRVHCTYVLSSKPNTHLGGNKTCHVRVFLGHTLFLGQGVDG